jgi:energy-converting hydrogenase Eha subunit E
VIFDALMVLGAIKAEVAGPDLSEPVIRGLDLFCAKLHNKVRCGLGLCAAWTVGESARQAFQCSAKAMMTLTATVTVTATVAVTATVTVQAARTSVKNKLHVEFGTELKL